MGLLTMFHKIYKNLNELLGSFSQLSRCFTNIFQWCMSFWILFHKFTRGSFYCSSSAYMFHISYKWMGVFRLCMNYLIVFHELNTWRIPWSSCETHLTNITSILHWYKQKVKHLPSFSNLYETCPTKWDRKSVLPNHISGGIQK
jgi:hypothetical protein